jgi:glycosyltransferase involved in cell wall biosynthesis
MTRVAVFTDNDFGKVNGVTTTLEALVRHAPEDIRPRIYTLSDFRCEEPNYLAVRSHGVPIPFYPESVLYLPRLRAFRRQLEADGVRLVHVTSAGPAGLAARYLARRVGARLIGSVHTELADYTPRLSGSATFATGMRHYRRWLYGTCDRVLVPSHDTRRRLSNEGWAPERLRVWARGVDVDTFSPQRRSAALRDRWRTDDRRPAVLYVGRLSEEKGVALLPPITSRLHEQHLPHRLIVVGDGPMRAPLMEALPDAVFTGHLNHDQVAVAMASADVFLFPSAADVGGHVVLEAQASGLPVIVSDQGGSRENMRDGESGFVCLAGSPHNFAARLHALASLECRVRMGRAARGYAEERSWIPSLAPVYSLYRTILRRQNETGLTAVLPRPSPMMRLPLRRGRP